MEVGDKVICGHNVDYTGKELVVGNTYTIDKIGNTVYTFKELPNKSFKKERFYKHKEEGYPTFEPRITRFKFKGVVYDSIGSTPDFVAAISRHDGNQYKFCRYCIEDIKGLVASKPIVTQDFRIKSKEEIIDLLEAYPGFYGYTKLNNGFIKVKDPNNVGWETMDENYFGKIVSPYLEDAKIASSINSTLNHKSNKLEFVYIGDLENFPLHVEFLTPLGNINECIDKVEKTILKREVYKKVRNVSFNTGDNVLLKKEMYNFKSCKAYAIQNKKQITSANITIVKLIDEKKEAHYIDIKDLIPENNTNKYTKKFVGYNVKRNSYSYIDKFLKGRKSLKKGINTFYIKEKQVKDDPFEEGLRYNAETNKQATSDWYDTAIDIARTTIEAQKQKLESDYTHYKYKITTFSGSSDYKIEKVEKTEDLF